MGLHTGLARFRDNDYAGLTVHAASRVESAAAGGQVLITAGHARRGRIGSRRRDRHARPRVPPAQGSAVGVAPLPNRRRRARARVPDGARHRRRAQQRPRPAVELRRAHDGAHSPAPDARRGSARHDRRARRYRQDPRVAASCQRAAASPRRRRVVCRTRRRARSRPASSPRSRTRSACARNATGRCSTRSSSTYATRTCCSLSTTASTSSTTSPMCSTKSCAADRTSACWPPAASRSRSPANARGRSRRLTVDDDDPASSEAVLLLVDRVGRVQPDFELTADLVPAAATIARRLDGLPLALELAAASATTPQPGRDLATARRPIRTAHPRQPHRARSAEDAVGRHRLELWPARTTSSNACSAASACSLASSTSASASSCAATRPTRRRRVAARTHAQVAGDSSRPRLGSACSSRSGPTPVTDCVEASEFEEFAERHANYFVDQPQGQERSKTPTGSTRSTKTSRPHALGRRARPRNPARALVELQPFWMRKGRWTEGRPTSEEVLAATTDVQ